jgi:hypothetical protein
MGGTAVINITAWDSQDVLRAFHKHASTINRVLRGNATSNPSSNR